MTERVLRPVTPVFVLIRRWPGARDEAAFEVWGVFRAEEEAHAKAQELNDGIGADADYYFYYVKAHLHD
jgi:hypothetical protein